MKKVIGIALCLLTIACSKADFSKIKSGMTTKEVTALVGEPKEKQEIAFLGASYWVYETHVVTMVDGKVERCLTNEEFGKQMQDFTKEVDKTVNTLEKSLKTLDSI
ncbi:hypothetical protein V3471_00635 [Flavobacterium oreochromis]|uniref:hypothetical protein n=1 Tax=Flavobacterium oreochromis TaxID=2906078 RepID=UPI000CDAE395|nr:hypothetical protein BWK58_06555 [Flavobacterium columnare]